MEQLIHSDQDKLPAIEYCKNHIQTNGYCAVRHALKSTVPGKRFISSQHERAFYNSISSLITRDGKYRIKQIYPDGNIDIELNPNYKKKSFSEKHYFIDRLLWAVIPAILGLISGLIINRLKYPEKSQIDMQQDQQIKDLYDSVNILQRRISDSAE